MRIGERMRHLHPLPMLTVAAGLLLAVAGPSLAATLGAVTDTAPSLSGDSSQVVNAYEGMQGPASLAHADTSLRGRVLLDAYYRSRSPSPSDGNATAGIIILVLAIVLPLLGALFSCCACFYCYKHNLCCFEGKGDRDAAEHPTAVTVLYPNGTPQVLMPSQNAPLPPAAVPTAPTSTAPPPPEWFANGVPRHDFEVKVLRSQGKACY
jgi:hypothetical protein